MAPNGVNDLYLALIESTPVINGRYHQPRRLAGAVKEGYFSLIFQARDMQTGREVVLKFFDPRHDSNQYRREAFRREARLLAEFSGQPNILLELLEGEQAFEKPVTTREGITVPFRMSYFATELAPGSLKDYIYSEANNPRDSLVLFRETCKGVQRIHSRDVVHRDLKPGNCLIFPGLVVKLCDFGTARKLGEAGLASRYDLPVGDLGYTAFEFFCGMGNNPKFLPGADFFSLGAILFELFTRQILTQLVYDFQVLENLSQLFARDIEEDERKDQVDRLLPSILGKWVLPELSTVQNLVPPSIRGRVNLLYKRLAELDYRNRARLTFEWIFREIDICVKILDNEEKYQRWLEFRRRRQQHRELRQARVLRKQVLIGQGDS